MASSQHLPSGTLLMGGKYKVGRILGQGTFGITYMALTKSVITGNLGTMEDEAKVAIKEFFIHDLNKRETSTPNVSGADSVLFTEYRRKFRKEALHLTKLSHPGIVRVLDVFDENGTTYYAMEFVDGDNLDDYISGKGSLPVEEAVEAMTDIGAALDYMHSKKMLHLDIKPRNIMRKSDGTFRLIDFGLSKSFDGTGFSGSSSNIGLGTPGYASIEQSSSRKDSSFPVTMDVYALGATLFKMLTGEQPPESIEILNEGFPEETLKEKGIPTEIIEVVRKAMSPTVVQRYQSVRELVSDLQKARTVSAKTDDEDAEVVDFQTPPPVVIEEDPIDEDEPQTVNEIEEIENNPKNNPENSRPPLPTVEPTDNTDINQTSQPTEGESQQNKTDVDSSKTAKKGNSRTTLIIALLTVGMWVVILFLVIKLISDKSEANPKTGISSKTENLSNSQTDPVNQIDGEYPKVVKKLIDPASETGQTDAIDTTESEMVESEKYTDKPSDKIETKVTGPTQITQNGTTYTLDWSNKTTTVEKASKNITTANIPTEINCNGVKFKVTEIGSFAFASCKNLTSVTIPNSVMKIEWSAFSNCKNLTSVTIPNSVTKIGQNAFAFCESLTSVTIPNSVTEIGSFAFENCISLTSVTIPNSVTVIGSFAFEDCISLTSVKIPDSVKEIGYAAFKGCSNLNVTYPASAEIGDRAFYECRNATPRF